MTGERYKPRVLDTPEPVPQPWMRNEKRLPGPSIKLQFSMKSYFMQQLWDKSRLN